MLSLGGLASKIFGSSNERRIKVYRPKVEAINAMEGEISALSDADLRAKTDEFRRAIADGAKVDTLLVPAFAVVREAAKRTLGQRHFDVQLMGGMVLHEGNIAEMRTGEGKTLVATLPVYLNALTGNGVHVVTVNDYLAKRDAEWMGQVYRFLGLTVGCIVHDLDDALRQEQYACDVTYGTNNELGFDYLRDNMKMRKDEMVQRGHSFAIVDEVDSILVDEARTPLIISGPVEDRAELYNAVDALMAKHLEADDFELDEKQRQVALTDAGNEKFEQLLEAAGVMKGSLYDIENVTIVHHVNQALKAHKLFQRDKDYIVKAGQVVIIDEFTGRMMPGRRYSEGLHQALEAKEHVDIQPENQTLASITFQNYFRLYDKLGGMTGTAMTEASEFMDIRPRGGRHPDQPARLAHRRGRRDLPDPEGEVRGDRDHDGRLLPARPARTRRHDVDREVRAALRASQEPRLSGRARTQAEGPGGGLEEQPRRRAQGLHGGHRRLSRGPRVRQVGEQHGTSSASGFERSFPRAGSLDRSAGGRSGRDHDRDQHGRPRHRHPARRQR